MSRWCFTILPLFLISHLRDASLGDLEVIFPTSFEDAKRQALVTMQIKIRTSIDQKLACRCLTKSLSERSSSLAYSLPETELATKKTKDLLHSRVNV